MRVTDIAEQYYCEKALELSLIHGEVKNKRMKAGKEGHEALDLLNIPTDSETIVQKTWRRRSKPYEVSGFNVIGLFNGVPIWGKADEVWFKQGKIVMVIENKFSNRLYPYNPYRVQAQLYCMLLETMCYDTSNTQYKIRIFMPECRECEKLMLASCPIFQENKKSYQCKRSACEEYTYAYDRDDITKDVKWALNFWLDKRKDVPTTKFAKCLRCDYSNFCDSSPLKNVTKK